MKILMESFKKFLKEAIDLVCPPVTQDLELNTKNNGAEIFNHCGFSKR